MASGDRIQCFFLTPTERALESLRRWRSGDGVNCPVPGNYYHNAYNAIGIVPWSEDHDGHHDDGFDHADPRWPTVCPCGGYTFTPDDNWQHCRNRLFARSDGGRDTTIGDAPVGAMWYADWMPEDYRGPDGHTLVVKTPGGDWMPDQKVGNPPKPWTRTGTPPVVTAQPSIGIYEGRDKKRFRYHGWLRDGWLVEC